MLTNRDRRLEGVLRGSRAIDAADAYPMVWCDSKPPSEPRASSSNASDGSRPSKPAWVASQPYTIMLTNRDRRLEGVLRGSRAMSSMDAYPMVWCNSKPPMQAQESDAMDAYPMVWCDSKPRNPTKPVEKPSSKPPNQPKSHVDCELSPP